MKLKGKTAFITGGSRGIGKAIALKLASHGCQIVIAAKTAKPHNKLEGTIYTAAQEVEALGVKALPIVVDVREESLVESAVKKAVEELGGIDYLINNASAIFLAGTLETPMKRFDLMHSVNVRASYLCAQKALPYLLKSENPHILNLSPPLNMDPRWFKNHTAYTMSKYGMSMCVLGMSEEFRKKGIAVNALWPKTTIATAAVQNLPGGDQIYSKSRSTEIVADAAYEIIISRATEMTGNFFIDEDLLKDRGYDDFEKYAITPGEDLMPDFFL